MSNENKVVAKKTILWSTVVTSLLLALIVLFQEYGVNYIQQEFALTTEAKVLSDEISSDKINYVDEVANKILHLDDAIQTVVVCKFEPDKVIPKEVNRLFVLRDRDLTFSEYKKTYKIKDITMISEMPMVYYTLLGTPTFEIGDDTEGGLGITKSTFTKDKNMIFGMYSYNSPSGWVGVILPEGIELSQEVIEKVKALTYRINLILF